MKPDVMHDLNPSAKKVHWWNSWTAGTTTHVQTKPSGPTRSVTAPGSSGPLNVNADEMAAACAVAAGLTGKAGSGKIVCVVSGGNIDPKLLAEIRSK